MIAMVPSPSLLSSTIRAALRVSARLLRSRTIDCKRPRSAAVTSMLIPLRMPHHRTADPTGQPVSGLFRQVLSTR